jgi:hypothetical protein
MHVLKLPTAELVIKLKARIPFTYSRWGDGEWMTITGFIGMRNSNGCTFTNALRQDFIKVLKRNNPYYHTVLRVGLRERPVFYEGKDRPYGRTVIDKFIADNELGDVTWYDGDTLLADMLNGQLFPLIEQVRERRVLYVGNKRLRGLNMRGVGFFPYVTYVEPPPTNSHDDKARILNEVFAAVRKYKIDFIGWSAGMAAKVFIDETFMEFPDVTQLDFGSTFDGYFPPLEQFKRTKRGVSRGYIPGNDWDKLLRQNTGRG